MSEQVEKLLSELVKMQLEKKSSKKSEDDHLSQERVLSEEELAEEEEKALVLEAKKESNSKMINVEKWAMWRRLIIEYVLQLSMLLAYCVVFGIAMVKFGSLIIIFVKNFLHGIFIPVAAPK